MKHQLITLAVAACCMAAGAASAMTKEEHKAQENRIEADYKAAKVKCDTLKANAKDVCEKEAKGAEKVAKAELDAAYKPDAKASEKVARVKAEAAYDVAKEKCDDMTGNAKDSCVADAKKLRKM